MKKIRLKKGVLVFLIILLIIIILIASTLGFYFWSLKGFDDKEIVTFEVQEGVSKIEIVDDLKSAGLVKSKMGTLAYLVLNKDLMLQAGTYTLSRDMGVKKIISKIYKGDVKLDTISITFVEGKNINDYIDLISSKMGISKSDVKAVFESKEFMQKLIEKYDFLTEAILNDNIYYALEGYLFPDTYEFLENASVEDVITLILDNTKAKLGSIEINSDYSIHDILSMASIAELEAVKESDRQTVAQVIYKRLNMGMNLGMDVTTYYAVQKTLGEELTINDLNSNNPYNTRNINNTGLPVGPICNPSLESIKAVLNPSDTDYIYFYANIETHEVFFANTYEEFIDIQRKVG